MAEWALCKAADTYQWYNREVLRAAARKSPTILKGFPNKRVAAKVNDRVGELISGRELKDWAVREHLHKHLGMWEESEMALLVRARNCLVHAMGLDTDGEMETAIENASSPWKLNLTVERGKLQVAVGAAETAIRVTMAQVSLMDQEFARLHDVPAKEHKSRTFKRIMS